MTTNEHESSFGSGRRSLDPVRFTIHIDPNTRKRAERSWQIQTVVVDEGLGRPHRINALVRSNDAPALEGLLGARLELEIARGDRARQLSAVITAAVDERTSGRDRYLRIHAVHPLGLLGFTPRRRIFERTTAITVVTSIVEPALARWGGTLDASRLGGLPPVAEYLVQYQETDLAFVQRLLADAGVTFFAEGNSIVLVDHPSKFEPIGAAHPGDASQSHVLFVGERNDAAMQGVRTFSDAWQLTPAAGSHDLRWIDELRRPEIDEATLVAMRSELEQSRQGVATGTGNHTAFTPGRTWTFFDGHPAHAMKYAIVEVTHHGEVLEPGDMQARYSNHFRAVASGSAYLAAPVAKPRIAGVQTALIVAKGPDDELSADELVRVRMHWEDSNDAAWCFLRVPQSWAQVGRNVIVSFIDGDPDRPTVIGCLRDDGETFVHAPGNLRTRVIDTEIRAIGGAQRVEVNGLRQLTVGGEDTTVVRASRSAFVEKHDMTAVTGTHVIYVLGSESTAASNGDEIRGAALVIESGDYTVNVDDGSIALRSGNASISISRSKVSIRAPVIEIDETGDLDPSDGAHDSHEEDRAHAFLDTVLDLVGSDHGPRKLVTLAVLLANALQRAALRLMFLGDNASAEDAKNVHQQFLEYCQTGAWPEKLRDPPPLTDADTEILAKGVDLLNQLFGERDALAIDASAFERSQSTLDALQIWQAELMRLLRPRDKLDA